MRKHLLLASLAFYLLPTAKSQSVSDYDGNIYPIVKIGSQWWMAKNLQTTHYADGTPIAEGTSAGNLELTPEKKYYFSYNNVASNSATYGYLYTWAAAANGALSSSAIPSNVQGACPTGWHLPSDGEWVEALNALGGDNAAGGKMKELGSTHWEASNTNADNSSGMTILPAGLRNYSGVYAEQGQHTYLWSSTEVPTDPGKVYSRHFESLWPSAYQYMNGKPYGLSVRCVKDGLSTMKSSFSPNQSNGMAPFTVAFSNASQGSITTYFWDFGDGSFSNLASPSHTYTADGIFNVCLTVEDGSTKEQSISCKNITVGSNIVGANFGVTAASKTISTTYNSTVGTMQYLWQFGDATVSTQQTPTYTYTNNGYYRITLSALNDATGQISQEEKIVAVGDTTKDCEAEFTYTVNLVDNAVSFTNASRGVALTAYTWDLGDGSIETTKNATHTYAVSDFYQVCLTASNTVCKNITCKDIKVGSSTSVSHAQFIYVTDKASNKVYFYDRSLNAKTWKWDLGNGQTSSVQHPQHTYSKAGMYTVILETTDNNNIKSVYNMIINVHATSPKLKGHFVAISPVTSKGLLPIEFKGHDYGDASEVEWDFGDGETSSSTMAPTHEYKAAGSYYVCMTVTNKKTSQTDTYCDSVKVVSTSINNEELKMKNGEWSMYPNPIQSKAQSLKFKVNTAVSSSVGTANVSRTDDVNTSRYSSLHSPLDVTITNTLGQVVLSYDLRLSTYDYQIDVSQFDSGVYFVRVGNSVKKLIVNN